MKGQQVCSQRVLGSNLSFRTCEFLPFSEPRFPHLENGSNSHFKGHFWGFISGYRYRSSQRQPWEAGRQQSILLKIYLKVERPQALPLTICVALSKRLNLTESHTSSP